MKNIKKIQLFKKLKFSKFGRRQLILAGLIVMIAIAGYINLTYESNVSLPASSTIDDIAIDDQIDVKTTPNTSDNTYFSTARVDREKSRSAAMDIYREIIKDPSSAQDVKTKAQNNLSLCAKSIENEATIENLLKAKGFEEAVVYITDGTVSVVVKTTGLIPAQVSQIKDLVIEKTSINSDKIKIVEIK